jgi:hypothetical protein
VSTNTLNPNAPDPGTGVIIFHCGSEAYAASRKTLGQRILQAMAYTDGGTSRTSKRVHRKSDAHTMARAYSNRCTPLCVWVCVCVCVAGGRGVFRAVAAGLC